MRKAIYSISVLAMMAVALFSITSCGSDDKDETKPAEEATVKEVQFQIETQPNEATLNLFNLYVVLESMNEKTKEGAVDMNNTKFQQTITKFPDSVTISLEYVLKQGVEATDVKLSKTLLVNVYYLMSDGSRKQANDKALGDVSNLSCPGKNLMKYLEKNPIFNRVTLKVDEKGKLQQ